MSAPRPLVVAALSGGVDSATAAAMLVEAGHRVVGMTLRLYDASGTRASSGGRCCGPRDMEDARRVCAHLGIPYYVVDMADEFERRVVDDFAEAYLEGRTPNPCARCNQYIKFSPLLRRARALGADLLATGHYARIEPDGGGWQLRRGRDRDKDQSYFLFAMPAGELGSILFPLGGLSKEEVRQRASQVGLPNAAKPESQEICFVPDGDYAGFVERRALARGGARPAPGPVVDASGTELARHDGVHRYTVGQRRGLGLARPGGRPLYVTRIDAQRGEVVVGEREDAERGGFDVGEVQWLGQAPAGGSRLRAGVQVRHRASPIAAKIDVAGDGGARVTLDENVVAAPGQAAVFYDGDAVLGGGWIR